VYALTPSERAYLRTFTIGPVVFQVYGTTNPGPTDLDVDWPVTNIHQLWRPVSTFTWRPEPAISDTDVAAFADYIGRGLAERALDSDF
jgi:hypothetical protein